MGPQGGLQLLVRAVHRVAVDGGGDRVELLPGSQATVSPEVNSKDNQISQKNLLKTVLTDLTPASTRTKFMQVFLWSE